MRLSDVEQDFPILCLHLEQVVTLIERPLTRQRRKVSRKDVLEHFINTRSYVITARHFHVAPTTVSTIVARAIKIATQIAGVTSASIADTLDSNRR